MEARYRSTLWACCFANFFQAVGSCFAILYVPLRGLYGLSFTDFGILVSLNFITQVASDVLFSKPVEKYGFRPEELLVVDDMKLAYTMAKKQNVPIAFAAWGRQNCPEICREMRALCNFCFDTPRQLEEFQFGD